jgi:hypothetical protein
MRKPNFLVVGVQKSGTTYLCGRLGRHKDIYFSNPKELLFFQKKDISDTMFHGYLKEYFEEATHEKYVGEGSVIYAQWPNALENIQKFLDKDIKIIICLRQPTDRALSFYLHNYKKGRFDGTEDILTVSDNIRLSPVKSSLYAKDVKRWIDAYGDNVSFQLFDDLLASPTQFLRDATDFLGLEPFAKVDEKAVNKGFSLIWKDDELTLNIESTDKILPTFSMEKLEALHQLFLEDIDETEKLISRDLQHWKKMPEFTEKQKNW